jgi:surfeit locus 1 family protein
MSRSWKGLVLLALVVGAVCVRLGFWQLDRLRERRARNAVVLAARTAEPVVLGPGRLGAELDQRRVRLRGEFDRSAEVVIRGATRDGGPGVRVMTPLRLEGTDTLVLVDRGFVPAPDAVSATLTGLDEPGSQEVAGIALAIPTRRDGGEPLERRGAVTWRGLDLAALRARSSAPLAPISVQQTPDSALPAWPRRQEPAALDDGPHLSYALQWFGFALIAVLGSVAVWIRAWKERPAPRS